MREGRLVRTAFTRLVVVLACWAATPSRAQDAPAVETIHVGTYLNQITGIDLKNNAFGVDFWIWFRWRDATLKPAETFEIIGGRILSRSTFIRKEFDGGVHYAACRVAATITKYWDLSRYPFDDHTLVIRIEDAEIDETRGLYIVDVANCGVDEEVTLAGWSIAGCRHDVARRRYTTNYGDTSLATGAESWYSRYTLSIDVARTGRARFFKVFFGLFMATLVSWCGFFIRAKDPGARVSVSVGSLFAAAAVMVSLNNSLPDSNVITLGDQLIFLSLGMILVSLLGSVTAVTLNYLERDLTSRRIDRVAAVLFPTVYLAALWLLVRG